MLTLVSEIWCHKNDHYYYLSLRWANWTSLLFTVNTLLNGNHDSELGKLFLFIFRSRKSLVLPTMQHAWHQTYWILHDTDSSLVSFSFKVESSLQLEQMSATQWSLEGALPTWDFSVSSLPPVMIMMCLHAWIQIFMNNLWFLIVHVIGWCQYMQLFVFTSAVAFVSNSSIRATICCLNMEKWVCNFKCILM